MRRASSLFAALLSAAAASAQPITAGITSENYVDIGDAVADLLNNSGINLSRLNVARTEDRPPALSPPRNPSSSRPSLPFKVRCPGGGAVEGRAADNDANGKLSPQDRFVTVYRACKLGGDPLDGRSEFTVTRHVVDGSLETTELAFHFDALGTPAMRWSGDATMVLTTDHAHDDESYVVTYHHLAVTRGTNTTYWDFTLEMTRPSMSPSTARINGTLTGPGATLKLTQNEDFVLSPGGTPQGGGLTVVDPQGGRLQVAAGTRRYNYRFHGPSQRDTDPGSRSFSARYPAARSLGSVLWN